MSKRGLVLAVAFTGCVGQAVMVRRDQNGGVLALRGLRDRAMEDANRQMALHCGGAYTIVAEENAVVGQQTTASAHTQYGEWSDTKTARAVTSEVTEYRITYACAKPVEVVTATPPAAQPVKKRKRAPKKVPPPDPAI
jgi:hypothetical protein